LAAFKSTVALVSPYSSLCQVPFKQSFISGFDAFAKIQVVIPKDSEDLPTAY
jgi:hypothetical protein